MKKRTRVFAWILVVMASLGILQAGPVVLTFVIDPERYSAYPAFRAFMVVDLIESLLLLLGSIGILRRNVWAWKLLVGLSMVLIAHFFIGVGMAHSRLAGRVPSVVLIFLVQCVLQPWVLLTDRPADWSQPANRQSEIPNPQ